MGKRGPQPGSSIYDQAKVTKEICERISSGETLRAICMDEGFPSAGTFCGWTLQDASIAEQYARAREARADARADRIDSYIQRMFIGEIDPQQCRVAIDAEKWQAAHEMPKRYGDRLELAGEVGVKSLSDEQVEKRLSDLLSRQKLLDTK